MNPNSAQPIGLIAGSRSLPLLFAREAKSLAPTPIVAVGFRGETDPELERCVDELVWVRVGQLTKLIEVFRQRGVSQCVMLGQIAPRNLFDIRPDLRALGLLLRVKEKNAHSLFTAIIDELAKEGIRVIEATPWLHRHMPGPGFHWGPKLGEAQLEDVRFGQRIAKEIARLDIGQLVVVKNGTVLAVEGFEGTDACLARGGELAGKKGGAVAVKVSKPNHDMRFDIPCVGPATIAACRAAGVAVLAIESHRTLLIEREALQARVAAEKVALLST